MAVYIHPKLNYYIFGHNISHSLSPTLHNAGFKALNLPYHYSIHQSVSVDKSVEDIISRPDFGGASVTYPHKLHVGRLLDTISPQAQQIGAINTIIAKQTPEGRILSGDNSDWAGIKACIDKSGLKNLESSPALVLGAGGAARAACYAIKTIGIREIAIVNRTRSKAEATAANFPDMKFQFFDSLDEYCASKQESACRVVVACIPADDLVEELVPGELFSQTKDGVLVEMAYRPAVTGMMKVAAKYEGWKLFKGVDILEEQAFVQFELWTGKPAPKDAMKEAVVRSMSGNSS